MQADIHPHDSSAEYFFAEGCHIIETANDANDPHCSIARARVEPGKTTHWHQLIGVVERYLIISGEGLAEVGAQAPAAVSSGDVVLIPANMRQRITNTGATDLVFYAICTPRFTRACYQDLDGTNPPPVNDEFAALYQLLEQYPDGISEYELFRCLADQGHPLGSAPEGDNADHSLFQKHFRLFHALYRLRDRGREQEGFHLDISALNIQLLPYTVGRAGLAQPDPLRSYYLDASQLNTSAEQLDEMLGAFWGRLQHQDGKEEALALMGLTATASYEDIRRRYRQLAMEHHPDRGGDTEQLQAINAAMDLLAKAAGKRNGR